MAFGPPDRTKEPIISTTVARGMFDELLGIFRGESWEFLEGTVGNLLGISRGLFLMMIFSGLLGVLWYQIPNLPLYALAWGIGTMPLWLPIVAIAGGWRAWRWYVQSNFIASKKNILLEVKMPRELVKSPRAMDVALSQLWMNMGEVTFMNRSWMGTMRPFFALELASFGGEVHFFIWTWESHRRIFEACIYAQYPEVEIVEVEDYAMKFEYDPDRCFAGCLDLRYEPLNDAYQLKSYVDFELDKDPKEEYKIDPFAQVLETLSALKPTEQAWISIVFTSNVGDMRRAPKGAWWQTENRWKGLLQEEIDHIREKAIGDIENERWRTWVRIQQYRQTEQIRSIDRHMSKHPFNVGIHVAYIATPPDEFEYPMFVRIREVFHPFGNPGWGNYLRYRRWHVPFDYPYQDLWDMRWNLHARRFFDCYRRRAHFYSPYTLPHNMMSTETIASIWHPATSAIKAPGLERVPAKKAEPPPNLPT